MSEIITDELRWYLLHYPPANYADFSAIADRIDAEHKEACRDEYNKGHNDGFDSGFASADDWLAQHEDAMAEHGWVRLPVDADGVPIRVGDVMEINGEVLPPVSGIGDSSVIVGVFGVDKDDDITEIFTLDLMRHYHAPTVENALLEMLEKAVGYSNAHTTAAINAIAEYAAKLQLKGDE